MDEIMDYNEAISKYDVTFGVEVHVELNTKTKVFCPAEVTFGAEPNSQTTPVSLGLPGSLPVLNEKVLESAIKIGLALNCSINEVSYFARKNYFYPDLTKNYQISQAAYPTVGEGHLDLNLENGKEFTVKIERAHIEEDAGKSNHIGGTGRIQGASYSLIDYNRAGVPLVEIVTHPNLATDGDAPQIIAQYVKELRDIFKALDISDARMERGNVRADINVSLSEKDSGELGTRTETKNLNSFRSIEKAAEYEICRQAAVLESGKTITQETRHWHEDTLSTSAGRIKSDADDYRYFPEPDLPPVVTTKEQVDKIKVSMPELPAEKRARLEAAWGFDNKSFADIVNASALDLIEEAVKAGAKPETGRKWYMGELSRWAKENQTELSSLKVTPNDIAFIEKCESSGKINDKIARTILQKVLNGEGSFESVLQKENLEIVQDSGVLEKAVDDALEQNPDILEKLKSGNMAPMGVIIGQVMKATSGQADAKAVTEIIRGRL
ncbi:MAG: Asp-tRNA(Asn)/Glu-tRNA(Gln) amidotransferase subunit GatB [Bifidobacteriaceae bacterium]|jgi:aspartyl-tRNA(Asn)/glutamyl-tRNA(Gln) amidotransferase subunit B|nr:Asp-tRNA(Asn)/Glu-tRNA(Gln) amidotransferase subunit GatB [Bifidobacteriaceae bacterium]